MKYPIIFFISLMFLVIGCKEEKKSTEDYLATVEPYPIPPNSLKQENPELYYQQFIQHYLKEPKYPPTITIKEKVIYVTWEEIPGVLNMWNSEYPKPETLPRIPYGQATYRDDLAEAATFALSLLQKAGLPDSLGVTVEAWDKKTKEINEWGDKKESKRTLIKATWDNTIVQKIFQKWTENNAVNISKVAKYWYLRSF